MCTAFRFATGHRYTSIDDPESGLAALHHLAAYASAAPTKAALVSLFTCLRKAFRHDDVLEIYRAYANCTLEPLLTRGAPPDCGVAASTDVRAGGGATNQKKTKLPLVPEVAVSTLEGWPVEVDYNLASHVCASCEATAR